MAVLRRPVTEVPEYVVTMEETLALAADLHRNHAELRLVRRLITNTGVRKRQLVQPLEQVLRHPG